MRLPVILSLFLCSCSFFKRNEAIIKVGDISFSESYFSDRLVEKLKNVDGLHIKNKDLILSLSSQLEKELIQEAFFFMWAQKNKLKIDPSDLSAYLGTQATTTQGAPTDFIFEAAPSQNLLQNHLRLQIIKNHFFTSLDKDILVTDEELQTAYKQKSPILSPSQVHLRQILLTQQEEAQAVLAKIRSGSSFEEMAKKFSLSSEGATGGDLHWIRTDSSPQIKQLAPFTPGLVNRVIAGSGGFYIYKIIEYRKPTTQSFAQVSEELKKTILEEKRASLYLQWLKEQVRTVRVYANEDLIHTVTTYYQETL